MKNVLINALILNKQYSGVQYSVEYFVDALSQINSNNYKFTALVSKEYDGKLFDTDNLSIKRVSFDSSNRFKRIAFENFVLPKYYRENKFDIFHSPNYTLPFFPYLNSVVTIHDLIALDFPALCKFETTLYYNIFLPFTIRQSKKIIAVSQTVKQDILKKFPGISCDKIEVIHHGIHSRFKKITNRNRLEMVRAKYQLPNDFFLFVGNLEPKKNIDRIISAYINLKNRSAVPHKLVIVGKKGWKYSSIYQILKTADFKKEISLIGYVDENDLPVLYSMSTSLLFPSIYEGFGLPVLEAMACGCPVIVSNRGALPEVSGNIAPQINPYEVSDIENLMLKMATDNDFKEQLIIEGLKWARNFTWEENAKKTLKAYEAVLSR